MRVPLSWPEILRRAGWRAIEHGALLDAGSTGISSILSAARRAAVAPTGSASSRGSRAKVAMPAKRGTLEESTGPTGTAGSAAG